jgi:hypothetical protein
MATRPDEAELQPAAITPEVAASLYSHLQEQSRAFGSVRDLEALLARAVTRHWGTANARRFRDSDGGGWLVDLSEFLDGEELYGMVRSSIGGSRLMTAIVDADELARFQASGSWSGAGAAGAGELGDDEPPPDPQTLALAAFSEQDRRQQRAEPQRSPGDPMLILVMPVDGGAGDKPMAIFRGTREEVPGMVKMLLSQGVGPNQPVAEGQIEIWASVSKPKVEIKF